MELQSIGEKYAGGKYYLKRNLLKLLGSEFFIYDPHQKLLFTAVRPIKLRDEITIFADDSKTVAALVIKARQNVLLDFNGVFDIFDSITQSRIGVMKRKAVNSIVRDEWEICDGNEFTIATLIEDSLMLSLLRRFATNLIPQNYDILVNGSPLVDLRQNFNPFSYHLNIEMKGPFDARLAIASAVLLASIDGKQRSF
jgi:hypothetical protein